MSFDETIRLNFELSGRAQGGRGSTAGARNAVDGGIVQRREQFRRTHGTVSTPQPGAGGTRGNFLDKTARNRAAGAMGLSAASLTIDYQQNIDILRVEALARQQQKLSLQVSRQAASLDKNITKVSNIARGVFTTGQIAREALQLGIAGTAGAAAGGEQQAARLQAAVRYQPYLSTGIMGLTPKEMRTINSLGKGILPVGSRGPDIVDPSKAENAATSGWGYKNERMARQLGPSHRMSYRLGEFDGLPGVPGTSPPPGGNMGVAAQNAATIGLAQKGRTQSGSSSTPGKNRLRNIRNARRTAAGGVARGLLGNRMFAGIAKYAAIGGAIETGLRVGQEQMQASKDGFSEQVNIHDALNIAPRIIAQEAINLPSQLIRGAQAIAGYGSTAARHERHVNKALAWISGFFENAVQRARIEKQASDSMADYRKSRSQARNIKWASLGLPLGTLELVEEEDRRLWENSQDRKNLQRRFDADARRAVHGG